MTVEPQARPPVQGRTAEAGRRPEESQEQLTSTLASPRSHRNDLDVWRYKRRTALLQIAVVGLLLIVTASLLFPT